MPRKKPKKRQPRSAPARVGGDAQAKSRTAHESSSRAWWRRYPAIQFVVVFGVLMVLFYAVFYRPPAPSPAQAGAVERFINWYLHAYASAAGKVLAGLGYGLDVQGATLSARSSDFSVIVVRGCDAMEAIALFVCGVLAFPRIAWSRKVIGLALGVPFLIVCNFLRICSLYIVGYHAPKLFDVMHIDVWQVIFIVLTMAVWLFWLNWATQRRGPDAPQEATDAAD